MIREAIDKAINRNDLSELEAEAVMAEIMEGKALPTQIAAFLIALRMKGETIPEITGCAKVMRKMVTRVHTKHKYLVDTCGTGGDGAHTFNISTISAFVAAGAGVVVAKHGNRSVSSKCGSADLLEELGVNVSAPLNIVEHCLDEIGIAFMFAPIFHGAMKHAIGPRKEIGVRTIFNILGPLTNPAGAQAQILGVYDSALTKIMAHVLGNLGCSEAWVVHGSDGLDEVTTTGTTKVSRWINGIVEEFQLNPADFGIPAARRESLIGGDKIHNAKIALSVLTGEKGPARDIVVLNSAIAIICGKRTDDMREAIKIAEESIDSKKALKKLEQLAKITVGAKH